MGGARPSPPLESFVKKCKQCGSPELVKSRKVCKDCLNAVRKAHYQDNKDWYRNRNYKKEYGITLEEYEAMFSAQGGVCLICLLPERSGKLLAVDHDHATGEVRGLLCNGCNVALGMFLDDPERIERAARYVRGR